MLKFQLKYIKSLVWWNNYSFGTSNLSFICCKKKIIIIVSIKNYTALYVLKDKLKSIIRSNGTC